jgi:RNA recognition motif-containing protein
MNLYIGNISYRTRQNDLAQLFSNYGQVSSATIITDKVTGRSKGFGFVDMPNDNEALAAIEAVNGMDFNGRNLTVNQAKPREERPRQSRD